MASVIELRPAVETIAFSDDPDAKTYTVDITDQGVLALRGRVEEVRAALDAAGDDDREAAAEAVHEFIAAVAGEQCYRDALAYVAGGKPKKGTTYVIALMPLVEALGAMVMGRVAAVKRTHMEDHLGRVEATGDAI